MSRVRTSICKLAQVGLCSVARRPASIATARRGGRLKSTPARLHPRDGRAVGDANKKAASMAEVHRSDDAHCDAITT